MSCSNSIVNTISNIETNVGVTKYDMRPSNWANDPVTYNYYFNLYTPQDNEWHFSGDFNYTKDPITSKYSFIGSFEVKKAF